MLFCHLGKTNSIREISNGLRSAAGNLNHIGIERAPCKSSISYMNQNRDWRLFRDYYFELLGRLEPNLERSRKYARRIKRKVYIMDSTVIPLCLKLFYWARFRKRKGAIKLHTVLHYDTCLPVFVNMTEGRKHDLEAAKELSFPAGSVVVMDRAYIDYGWMNNWDSSGVYFVTRLKDNTRYQVTGD